MYKFYLIKELTNTSGQDGSAIAVYSDEDLETAKNRVIVAYHQTLAMFHNAKDVLYAVVKAEDDNGNVLGGTYKEAVDHREPMSI